MICRKCGSENTKIDFVTVGVKTNETSLIRKFVRICLICCTFGAWALIPRRASNSKMKNKKMCICQNCGASYKVK